MEVLPASGIRVSRSERLGRPAIKLYPEMATFACCISPPDQDCLSAQQSAAWAEMEALKVLIAQGRDKTARASIRETLI
jgi:hypothetical protein